MSSRTAHCLTALSVLAASVMAATAGAANLSTSAGDPPAMTVHYADLDLQTAQGIATLYHRLSFAAAQVCPRANGLDLYGQYLSHQCQQAAIARAIGAIGDPRLARVATDHGVRND